jgi:hypothetical protein
MGMDEPYDFIKVDVRYTTVIIWDYDEAALQLTADAARQLARELNSAAREVEARVDRYSEGQRRRQAV